MIVTIIDAVNRSKELVHGAKELVLDLDWLDLMHWLDLVAWLALLNCRFEI